jgi:hypothetical protein
VPPRTPTSDELRRQGSNLRLAINSRASCRSTTPERTSGRRGSRTPNGRNRTRFRDGILRQWQSFQSGPGRRRTCTMPITRTSNLLFVRQALSQLSYSPLSLASRSLAFGARALRARALVGGLGNAASQSRSGVPRLRRGAGGSKSSGKLRDKDSNLDHHVQSVASCLLDDPGSDRCPSTPCEGVDA